VVSWLQERGAEFATPSATECLPLPPAACDVRAADSEFSRYWIYSHHIYSKVKRRTLQDLAHQFRLTGFCLPGKPGIICVEVLKLILFGKLYCVKSLKVDVVGSFNWLKFSG